MKSASTQTTTTTAPEETTTGLTDDDFVVVSSKKRKCGRPRKLQVQQPPPVKKGKKSRCCDAACQTTPQIIIRNTNTTRTTTTTTATDDSSENNKIKLNFRGSYKNYKKDPTARQALENAVAAKLSDSSINTKVLLEKYSIPEATVRRHIKKYKQQQQLSKSSSSNNNNSSSPPENNNNNNPDENDHRPTVIEQDCTRTTTATATLPVKRRGRESSITSEDDRLFLSQVAEYRNNNKSSNNSNNKMTRKEMISLIVQLTNCNNRNVAKQHVNYLVRKKILNGLFKLDQVNVSTAEQQQNNQTTTKTTTKTTITITTKKTCEIRVSQQFRWHTLIDEVWEEHARMNLPTDEYKKNKAYFQLNLFETSVAGSSNGIVHVIGSVAEQQQNMDDYKNRSSIISIIRIGSAAGISGPWIFLVMGEDIEYNRLKDLQMNFGAPPGSKVIMTPNNANLDEETWIHMAPDIAKSIRSMDVIKDHPDWWVCLTVVGSRNHFHFEIPSVQAFADNKIELVLEEDDTTSHQRGKHRATSYDHQYYVTKKDPFETSTLIDYFRTLRRSQRVISQWDLIVVSCKALAKVSNTTWIESFKRVNLHPDFRINFLEWSKEIESRQKNTTADDNYYNYHTSLFDVMPDVWKNLDDTCRHDLCSMIDGFYKTAKGNSNKNESPWKKQNLLKLVQFVPLDEIHKIRGCYYATKIDPTVLKHKNNIDDNNNDHPSDFISWYQPELFNQLENQIERNEDGKLTKRAHTLLENEIYQHVCNYVSRTHNFHDERKMRMFEDTVRLLPSSYLDLDITRRQRRLLNPATPKEDGLGTIMDETEGYLL